MSNIATTYRKTKQGTWVVCGPAAFVKPGATVTVTTKAGKTKTETIVSIGKPFKADGKTMVYGYREERQEFRRQRQCQTGGNCSSFGTGRSCGADDCDGWE